VVIGWALLAFAVFASSVIFDFADSANTQAVTDLRPHAAARWSVTMYVIGLVGFYGLVQVSWWLAIPEVLGLYVGSWIAVTWQRHKRQGAACSRSL